MEKISQKRPRGRPREFDTEAALDRALEVFWRQGYEGTSINDLTNVMQIAPPSLYASFGSKLGVFEAAMKRYADQGRPEVGRIIGQAASAKEAVTGLLMLQARKFTQEVTPSGCMISSGVIRHSPENVRAASVAAGYRAMWQKATQDLLERAIESGELPKETDAGILARYISCVIEGMSVQAIDGATREDLEKIATLAIRAWPAPR